MSSKPELPTNVAVQEVGLRYVSGRHHHHLVGTHPLQLDHPPAIHLGDRHESSGERPNYMPVEPYPETIARIRPIVFVGDDDRDPTGAPDKYAPQVRSEHMRMQYVK